MIGSTRNVRVLAFATPVDMRKSFDALSALVTDHLKRDVLSGELFLFVGRNRKRAKVLFWDGTGLCVYAKRLERGKFAAPWKREGADATEPMKLTTSELTLFLEGSELVGRVPLSPAPFLFGEKTRATG